MHTLICFITTLCPLWPLPPMADLVVLLNLPSLTWEAMDRVCLQVEARKEQVISYYILA